VGGGWGLGRFSCRATAGTEAPAAARDAAQARAPSPPARAPVPAPRAARRRSWRRSPRHCAPRRSTSATASRATSTWPTTWPRWGRAAAAGLRPVLRRRARGRSRGACSRGALGLSCGVAAVRSGARRRAGQVPNRGGAAQAQSGAKRLLASWRCSLEAAGPLACRALGSLRGQLQQHGAPTTPPADLPRARGGGGPDCGHAARAAARARRRRGAQRAAAGGGRRCCGARGGAPLACAKAQTAGWGPRVARPWLAAAPQLLLSPTRVRSREPAGPYARRAASKLPAAPPPPLPLLTPSPPPPRPRPLPAAAPAGGGARAGGIGARRDGQRAAAAAGHAGREGGARGGGARQAAARGRVGGRLAGGGPARSARVWRKVQQRRGRVVAWPPAHGSGGASLTRPAPPGGGCPRSRPLRCATSARHWRR
jgi:hypothetical protein